MKFKLVFSSIASLLILSACSSWFSNSSPTNDNPVPESSSTSTTVNENLSYNPCDLLLESDVQEIFPESNPTLDQSDTEPNPIGQKICFYSASDTDQKYVQLSLVSAADALAGVKENASLKPFFESNKQFLPEDQIQDVSGIGTEAYYGGSGLQIGSGLHVLDDDHGVAFTVDVGLGFGNNDQEAHLAIEKSIAQKVISRL